MVDLIDELKSDEVLYVTVVSPSQVPSLLRGLFDAPRSVMQC